MNQVHFYQTYHNSSLSCTLRYQRAARTRCLRIVESGPATRGFQNSLDGPLYYPNVYDRDATAIVWVSHLTAKQT